MSHPFRFKPDYFTVLTTTAKGALFELKHNMPAMSVVDHSPNQFRSLTGLLLAGYPDNLKKPGAPRFSELTSMLAEQQWRALAIATGFVERWQNGAFKEIELMYQHLEVRCLMALDTVAMYFENEQPDMLHEEERKDAETFCAALQGLTAPA